MQVGAKMGNTFESIAAHSAQAPYYKYRTPYLRPLFTKLAEDLGLTKESVVIDLCCGCGEIATGIKGHVGRVHAIDGSAEMLALAPRDEKIVYYQRDVNKEPLETPELADHILIGRAIHWIEEEALARIVRDNLRVGGKVVILSTQWAPEGDWGPAYIRAMNKYKLNTSSDNADFSGKDKFSKIGYQNSGRIQFETRASMDIEYLTNYSISSSYGNDLQRIIGNIDEFRNDISNNLSPFLLNGALVETVISWAIFYERG